MAVTMIPIKDGKIELPADLRERYGIEGDSMLVVEPGPEGIVIRPAAWPEPEPEVYTPERIAEFHLNNAIDEADYAWAVAEVRRLAIDPASVPHDPSSIKPHRLP